MPRRDGSRTRFPIRFLLLLNDDLVSKLNQLQAHFGYTAHRGRAPAIRACIEFTHRAFLVPADPPDGQHNPGASAGD